MADTPSVPKVKVGHILVGLAITATTFFVIAWATSKGWKSGQKS